MDDPADVPIDGEALMVTAATASVPPQSVTDILARVQADLGGRMEAYEQSYECVHASYDRAVFLVPTDHWETVADRLGLNDREADAVRRAHNEQLEFLGTKTDRREEFEAALDIRDAVCIGR
ncbi:MAG: hypothetical protein ABEJ04_06035 [Halobacteriaceae archaeon]